ncbi:MAG: methyltransferase domain-containing protein [Anaeromyxobacteraceae bacterium]
MIAWDERFSKDGYLYGTQPNRWLEAQAARLAPGGRVLCLGEGEGRNAVYLAGRGHRVDAVDSSPVGLAKARALAEDHRVTIATTVADLAVHEPDERAYDTVVLVYVHLPPTLRPAVHARAAAALRKGGLLVLEAFTPAQLAFTSGGPKQPDWLFTAAMLREDFPGLAWDPLLEEELELDEGPGHRGRAAIVRGVGRRVA